MDSLKLKTTSKQVRRGEFLVRIGGCETCHTATNSKRYILGMEFAGGTVFRHGNDFAASSNLTPDPSGLFGFDSRRFVQTIRSGHTGARPLFSAMPWYFYRRLTTADLAAIFAYLRAVPPVSHRVDNAMPASE